MRKAKQRFRAMKKKFEELHGFPPELAGGLVEIAGGHLFEDEIECADGIALDILHNGARVRLFFKIPDCLLFEYLVQQARIDHPVFFD